MSGPRMRKRFLDCKGLSIEEAESFAKGLAEYQQSIMFWIGDLARYCESRWQDTHHQVWPEWCSPGMIQRAAGVTRLYPNEEDRQISATYTQYLQVARDPARLQKLQDIVDAGLTTDESRKAVPKAEGEPAKRWLLAVDCNYWLTRTYKSGAELDAGASVASWISRTVERLKAKGKHGVTDVVCCFDSTQSFRKELTKDWEDSYKGNRGPKDPEEIHQLHVLRANLESAGFLCVDRDGFEGDDLLASYAKQFDGHVTLLVRDKDLKQCLSNTCNMLTDVEWNEDPSTGDLLPDYKWYSGGPSKRLRELRKQREAAEDPDEISKLDKEIEQAQHPNLLDETGIRPDQWADFQAIMGDTTDCIKGAPKIGDKGANSLIKAFGTVDAAIQAARDDDKRLLSMERGAIMKGGLLKLAERVDIVRQLVTLRTDVPVPFDTRI